MPESPTSKNSPGQEIPAEQLRDARLNLVRGLLGKTIQTKMMRESFLLEQVGVENADKREEADAKLSGRARHMFHEAELPELKKTVWHREST